MTRRELSDWLSPVLVKEMRQGLKSRMFTAAFLIVQAIMLCVFLVVLSQDTGQEMRESSTVMFWGFTVVMLAVVMPAMALNSLATELKDKTFDLVLLLLVIAHLVWWNERAHNPQFPHGYREGIGEALWWSSVSVITGG